MIEKLHQLQQRAAAKNDFEIDSFKLMNNAVFGRSFIIYLLFYIESFIAGKDFIFMFICSYVLIH